MKGTIHPALSYLMGLRSTPPTADTVEAWWKAQGEPDTTPTPDPRGLCSR